MENVRTRGAGKAGVLGLCLAAVLAIAAAAATSASAALPEWGKCVAVESHEGKYADSNCIQPVAKVYKKYTGGYEWYTGERNEGENKGGIIGYNFEGGQIGPTTFEATNGKSITCSGGELYQLQIQGPKSVGRVSISFSSCESEGQECHSEFHEPGVLTDEQEWSEGEAFKGALVYLSGKGTGSPTVGLTLAPFRKPGESYLNAFGEPATSNGALFTVVCEGGIGSLTIGGAGGKKEEKAKGNTVISLIEPVDQMTGEYTQTFTQAAGVQSPTAPQTGKEKTLQMYEANENKWFQMGIASTFQDPAERGQPPTEIKAAL